MKRDRIVYCMVVAATLLMLLFFQDSFLLWLLAVEILLPFLVYAMLYIETVHMTVHLRLPHGGMAGDDVPVNLDIHGGKALAALGRIRVVMNYHNVLYDRDVQQELQIPAAYVNRAYEGKLVSDMCGEVIVTCLGIECYGVFDMCRVRLKPFAEQRIVVVPRDTMTTLALDRRSWGILDGEQTDTRKRGNDTAEIFDIREYQNGDDVRSIHWKLSSKVDKLLVREAGYATHFDTMVVFDAGENSSDQACSETVLAGVVDFAVTLSRKLLELPRPHYVGLYLKDTFVMNEMAALTDLAAMVQQSMSVPIQESTGRALSHVMANNMYDRYSRLIYIVNGDFPDKLYELAGLTHVVAICITDRVEGLTTMKKGSSTLIELPVSGLYDRAHYIHV